LDENQQDDEENEEKNNSENEKNQIPVQLPKFNIEL
jgi:hypothetical protein